MNDINLSLLRKLENQKANFLLLLDPDRIDHDDLVKIVGTASVNGVDGFLIGSSLITTSKYQEFVRTVKNLAQDVPVILFPGNTMQISDKADAILFMSLISGRNPEYLIHQQMLAAPIIKKADIESISTAYMLIESGKMTAVEYISDTRPIPRDKPEITVAHAMAAELIGYKWIYLEGGSGAKHSVPNEMIRAVRDHVSLPIIVGGGIRDPETALEKVKAGASFIVCGNFFEDNKYDFNLLEEMANAIHTGSLD